MFKKHNNFTNQNMFNKHKKIMTMFNKHTMSIPTLKTTTTSKEVKPPSIEK